MYLDSKMHLFFAHFTILQLINYYCIIRITTLASSKRFHTAVKTKFTLEETMKAQRRSRNICLLVL